VPPTPAQTPASDVDAKWQLCAPDSAARFSAVGYFFASKLSKELNVPIGVIQSAVGGTPAEAWTPTEVLRNNPIYDDVLASRANAVKMTDEELKVVVDKIEAAWKVKVDPLLADPSSPDPDWFTTNAPLSGWADVQVPGAIDTQLGLKCDGSFWVRKSFEISADDAAQPATLHLGKVDDFDFTWVNGKLVGKVGREDPKFWQTPREYPLPVGTLKAGTNVVIVRVIDQFMEGGFTSAPSILSVRTHSGSIPLAGTWQARLETDIGRKPNIPGNNWSILSGMLYDGMIAPLVPYAFRGVIWYQGESNAGRARQYRQLFPLMIQTWRTAWKAEFPFYFVQLANFQMPVNEPSESTWAELREAQTMTLSLPKTAMAVTIDIGEAKDIHPKNKLAVGDRLAAIALAQDYGKQVPYSGPLFKSMKISGGKAYLSFTDTIGGLVTRPLAPTYHINTARQLTAPLVRNSPKSELEGFAIRGADKKWVWANAKIEGDSVIVWSDEVPAPTDVRYAWADNPFCNLYNGAGFPASPFRTDTQ
jgi:sialate O-acetylesterase